MKIVKFKNGKFGVRKFSWCRNSLFPGWEFAINHSGEWAEKNSFYVQEFVTLEEAREVLEGVKYRDEIDSDTGLEVDMR
jgi:hypothetical protein